jgi:hypothetical protein
LSTTREVAGWTGFVVLHVVVAWGLFVAAVPTVVAIADLWLPEHTGVFFAGDRLSGAGVLAHPGGTEVHAGWVKPIATCVAAGLLGAVVTSHLVGLRMIDAWWRASRTVRAPAT